jgi:hypothetical protein
VAMTIPIKEMFIIRKWNTRRKAHSFLSIKDQFLSTKNKLTLGNSSLGTIPFCNDWSE